MTEGWAKVKTAAKYAGLGERTFRELLKQGLKHSRLPSGTILISYRAIDEFLEGFAVSDDQVDQIVTGICEDLNL